LLIYKTMMMIII